VTVRPFGQPVHSVALVAGLDGSGPVLYAVGLTLDGPMELRTVRTPGVVFAPEQTQADVETLLWETTNLPDLHAVSEACGRRRAPWPVRSR
jgi:hypothetical protein